MNSSFHHETRKQTHHPFIVVNSLYTVSIDTHPLVARERHRPHTWSLCVAAGACRLSSTQWAYVAVLSPHFLTSAILVTHVVAITALNSHPERKRMAFNSAMLPPFLISTTIFLSDLLHHHKSWITFSASSRRTTTPRNASFFVTSIMASSPPMSTRTGKNGLKRQFLLLQPTLKYSLDS